MNLGTKRIGETTVLVRQESKRAATIGVCHDCQDRHVGCHADCDKYKQERKKLDDKKEFIRKKKEQEDAYYLYRKSRRRK